MKLFALGLSACSAFLGIAPTPIENSAHFLPIARTPLHLDVISMTTAKAGFALGDTPSSNGYGNLVLRTSDGGSRWVNVAPHGAQLGKRALCAGFAGPESAAFVTVNAKQKLQVDVTLNNGRTWTQSSLFQTSYGDGNLSIQFVDRLHGFVEVSSAGMGTLPGELFATANGGLTWHRVATSGPMAEGKKGWLPFAEGFSFENPKDGWMGGWQRAAGQFGGPGFLWLFRSTDGGVAWTHVSLTVPKGWGNATTIVSEPEWFGQTGFLTVEYSNLASSQEKTFLYKTSDGGSHWTVHSLPGNGTADFVNAHIGYTVVAGHLWRTDNSGVSWKLITTNSKWQGAQVQFATPTIGWVTWYDSHGTYWQMTIDGGRTWKAVMPALD